MALFWLSDEAWTAIEPHLPKNQPRRAAGRDRRVISGIVHVLKVGCRWVRLPCRLRAIHDDLQPVQLLGAPGLLA
ncbi:transposase [Sphingomonas sp. SORGH_AS 950]|nr:transposase [Sphingomonas sp. SORGH_AS_0950]